MANLLASSVDVYLGYAPLPEAPVAPSKGPLDIDLNEPVNSDGDTGTISFAGADATGGVFGGDKLRGSRVTLPVSKPIPGRLFWLGMLPTVFERGLVVRSSSEC